MAPARTVNSTAFSQTNAPQISHINALDSQVCVQDKESNVLCLPRKVAAELCLYVQMVCAVLIVKAVNTTSNKARILSK